MTTPDHSLLSGQVAAALAEDIGSGDLTAALVPAGAQVRARVVAREAAVLSGADWFTEVFRQLDPAIELDWGFADGERLSNGDTVCELRGAARSVLRPIRSTNSVSSVSAPVPRS